MSAWLNIMATGILRNAPIDLQRQEKRLRNESKIVGYQKADGKVLSISFF